MNDDEGEFSNGLSRIERLVVIAHYGDGLTLEEVAAVLEVSADEVRRVHARLVARGRRPRAAK